MDKLITFLGILSALGIPSVFVIIKSLIEQKKKIDILMKAQQAQMRQQLLDRFHAYNSKGWISDEELTEWENQYQAYHSLGQNGVLDAKRDILMKLPNDK